MPTQPDRRQWRNRKHRQHDDYRQEKRRRMDEDESVDADSDGFWSRMATALPQTTETALAQRGGGDDDGHVINGVPDDAINRPSSSPNHAQVAPPGDDTASDHPSDLEGTSDLDESERAMYISQRHVERMRRREEERSATLPRDTLAEMQRKRVAALDEQDRQQQSPPSSAAPVLTHTIFSLMQRTSAALDASPNPVQLEARIYANHGRDERFAFMRDSGGGEGEESEARRVWKRLRRGESVKWPEIDDDEKVHSHTPRAKTLLAGYDSSDDDDDDDDDQGKTSPEPTCAQQDDASHAEDSGTTVVGKAKSHSRSHSHSPNSTHSPPPPLAAVAADKLADRRARAREWAAKRSAGGGRAANEGTNRTDSPPFDLMADAPDDAPDDGANSAWRVDQKDVLRIG